MDPAFIEKDDIQEQTSGPGYKLSRFRDVWSVKVKDPTEQLQLVDYAQKERGSKNKKKLEATENEHRKLEKAFVDAE